jgi:hypothetical protein
VSLSNNSEIRLEGVGGKWEITAAAGSIQSGSTNRERCWKISDGKRGTEIGIGLLHESLAAGFITHR